MKLQTLSALAIAIGTSMVAAADSTTATDTSMPTSVDAASYISEVWSGETAGPTWATGKYVTTLASALYSAETSFYQADQYPSIYSAIYSAASKGDSEAAASLSKSGWDWGSITTNAWYTENVPGALQTAVAKYDEAWDSIINSVYAEAVSTTGSKNAAAAPKCTGMAVAGVVAGVAAVAGIV